MWFMCLLQPRSTKSKIRDNEAAIFESLLPLALLFSQPPTGNDVIFAETFLVLKNCFLISRNKTALLLS